MINRNEIWSGGFKGLEKSFISLLEKTDRPGRDDVICYLQSKTDFFKAPASANGHNNYEGGLVEHSLITYFTLEALAKSFPDFTLNKDSIIICALLHDVCKANFYTTETRNKKVDGQWVQEPYIAIDDKFPIGHGEKSVILIQNFMALTPHEQMAIRWHMGGFDDAARAYGWGMALTNAIQKYPLITFLHAADLFACLPEPEKKL